MKLAGVLIVVLALVGIPTAIAARDTAEPELEMEDFAFRPARKVVSPGSLVVWKNRDHAPHNATSLARRANGTRLFRTRTGAFRAELTARAPRQRGTYRYICTVHPRMTGVLVVR